MKYIIILLLLVSCGESTIKVEESEQKISGETRSYVILQLEFIQQMKTLCEEFYLPEEFDSDALYRQQVADCTFENLSALDLTAVEGFIDTVCGNPQTPQEIDTCEALGS